MPASFTPPDLNCFADSCPISAATVDVDFQVSDYATLPANLCPFSGRRELARFSEDFGEAVGETVKAKARSTVW